MYLSLYFCGILYLFIAARFLLACVNSPGLPWTCERGLPPIVIKGFVALQGPLPQSLQNMVRGQGRI